MRISPREYKKYSLVEIRKNHSKISSHIFLYTLRIAHEILEFCFNHAIMQHYVIDFMKKYARLTIDMSPEEHTYLKMASAQLGISMRKFVLLASFQEMKGLDDPWLSEKAEEAIKNLSKAPPQSEHISFT